MSDKSKALKNSTAGLSTRDSSLDLIRIAAFLSVIGVHFFYCAGFYNFSMYGKRMYVCLLLRTLFMDSVPLFLMLSGYLMNHKKASVRYYTGILKVLFMYLLAGTCCQSYSALQGPLTFKAVLKAFREFSAAPYGWYVEMYLGLYLLIPFLNLTYHALSGKKAKLGLIFTMILLGSLPVTFNMKNHLLPSAWVRMYPLACYFTGAYLSEYPPKIRKRYTFLLLAAHVLLTGSYIYYKSYNSILGSQWTQWEDFRNFLTALLVFLLIRGIHTENWNLKLKRFLRYISGLTFGAYLVSWIFDMILYGCAMPRIPSLGIHFEYLFVFVPVIALCSLLLSALLNPLNRLLLRGADWCVGKIQCLVRKHRKKGPAESRQA